MHPAQSETLTILAPPPPLHIALFQLEKDKQMLCIASNETYLAAGIDCYNKAASKLIENNKQDLALKLCVEVGLHPVAAHVLHLLFKFFESSKSSDNSQNTVKSI